MSGQRARDWQAEARGLRTDGSSWELHKTHVVRVVRDLYIARRTHDCRNMEQRRASAAIALQRLYRRRAREATGIRQWEQATKECQAYLAVINTVY
ncbi:hypothetical protein C8F04DRAFT_1255130 [Mycena alexandri]|uniref:Uncharacterized protein n=1 Tax=Mycena alexandri TaxID=1745969 RepID=A0AAD6X931_9AGAR|nr:hypothetical protein C8F04DRAFT_1255130 [Mycena alexandri]